MDDSLVFLILILMMGVMGFFYMQQKQDLEILKLKEEMLQQQLKQEQQAKDNENLV
jgi:uncharacterized protein HemX